MQTRLRRRYPAPAFCALVNLAVLATAAGAAEPAGPPFIFLIAAYVLYMVTVTPPPATFASSLSGCQESAKSSGVACIAAALCYHARRPSRPPRRPARTGCAPSRWHMRAGLPRSGVRADGSVAQSATYDRQGRLAGQATIEGSSRDSTWARGQSWAMLGLAQAAHLAGGEFTATAARVADWYLDHLPADNVCFWDFDDPAIPDAPRDTSATAIAAASLLKLAALGDARYREAAERIVDALAERHLTRHGGLSDGCYDQHQNLATASELIWGDYFLLEALLALDGVIKPGTL